MKTARAHRKFAIYSGFLDTILEGEEEIMDGETRKDTLKRILKDLEETAAELRKETMPHLHVPFMQESGYTPPPSTITTTGVGGPLVIDLRKEKIEIAIENASTIDELKEVKTTYPLMPVTVNDIYKRKMEELLSGGPKEFTENLD